MILFYNKYIICIQITVRYVMKPPNHCLYNIVGVWLLSFFTVIYSYRYRQEKCFENHLHHHYNNRDGRKYYVFPSKTKVDVTTCTWIIFVKIKSRKTITNTTTVFRIEFDFALYVIVAEWIPTSTNLLDNMTDGPVHLNHPHLYILYDIIYTHPSRR